MRKVVVDKESVFYSRFDVGGSNVILLPKISKRHSKVGIRQLVPCIPRKVMFIQKSIIHQAKTNFN